MYLMYVDESGDDGMAVGGSRFYVLSGIVVHEMDWIDTLDQLVTFRQRMRVVYGIKMNEEIRGYNMIHKPGKLSRIKRNDRLSIMRNLLDELAQIPRISIINIVIDKQGKSPSYDVFTAIPNLRLVSAVKHVNCVTRVIAEWRMGFHIDVHDAGE